MTDSRRDPETLGEIVRGLLDVKRREQVEPRHRIINAWERITASRRISGTRVGGWKDGTAVIEVDSPPLCAELAQFRRIELLDALREELEGNPALRDVRFRLGAFPSARRPGHERNE
ncbi:MAG: DUF721 domain-containing protein [Planctomycetota bacterium]